MWMKSKTESEEPYRANPNKENDEPMRPKLRKERVEPK
jgi:hypothetical protein